MKPFVSVLVVLAMTWGAAPGIAASSAGVVEEGLPNVERRAPAVVDTQFVGRVGSLLTGPSDDRPRQIALDYVRDHGEIFGLEKADFANLVLVARDVSPDGITHLRFNQVLDGIESVDSGLEAHVTADGRLINVSGAPVPGAELPGTQPELGAVDGLDAAREATDGPERLPRKTAVEPGPGQITTFASGELAQLRWSASPKGPVLAWQATTDGADGRLYDVLVSAEDGELLRRQDLTSDLGQNRYFGRDPDVTPAPTQITMPPAWYDNNANGTRLWGQYARTYTDPNDQDPAAGAEEGGTRLQIPASAGAPAAPDWLYTQSHTFPGATPCPSSGCTWNSATPATALVNQFQAASNLHVLVSRFHDYLAQPPIGFDEASGNFQFANTSGQGLGGDYVRAEVNDGEGFNNANMSTPSDGQAPRMQMFLFTSRDVNGSDDADVVYHEYGHGLSNRLVVNAGGGSTLSSQQPKMMGEAWSDFYALDLLNAEGFVTDTASPAEVTSGAYVVGGAGIRAKPIDCPVAPAGIVGCNGHFGTGTVLGGYTYGDIAVTDNTSPHAGSEVWAETLWEIRAAVGRQAALTLVTGGMRLSVDDPSMLDMRDAILQEAVAIRSAPGAADDYYATLWGIFAARGMGFSASTPSSNATNPTEAFNVPSGLKALGTALRDPYPGGDNDGMIEPGERFLVDQTIEGIGVVDLLGVTGALTSGNPALMIEDGTAAWPLLGKRRWAVNLDELAARLPVGVCTATSPLTITTTSTEGGVVANAIVDPRPASNAVVPLADATGVPAVTEATFTVPSGGSITDVDLRIDELRHTFLGDLTIALVHDGVTVTITERFDKSSFSGNDIVEAIFDDEAVALPSNVVAPVTGRVKSKGSLTAFDGHPAVGVWTLRVTDSELADKGTLRHWGLDSPQVGCGRMEIPAATTGAAGGVGQSAATLDGSVTPNGRATGLRFSYGTAPAYGASTPVQAVGAGDAAVPGVDTLSGLAPGTTYHYRVEAIREGGAVAVAGADRTFTTAPAPIPPLTDTTPPALSGAKVELKKAKAKGRKLATLEFTLSEPASVKAVLTRSAKGVRSGKRCVPPAGKKGKRCIRQLPVGTKTQAFAKAGAGTISLSASGLGKGRYTVTLIGTDAAGNSSLPSTLSFTVK